MIYRGDNTQAFNGKPIIVKLKNAENHEIALAEFRCGPVLKTFENPEFPLKVYFTSEESNMLKPYNTMHLAVYDLDEKENLRKHTCKESAVLKTKQGVV